MTMTMIMNTKMIMKMSITMTNILRTKELVFGREKPLTAPLSWQVEPGEIWAIVGENGCGKSTLLKTLLGFLPPLGGSCHLTPKRAYFAQLGDAANIAPATVRDVVALGLESGSSVWRPFYYRRHRAQIEEVLKAFNLTELQDRSFHEISPGERQRALLAQALVRFPQLLLLDEATAAMDKRHAALILELLVKYSREHDLAVVAVSHHLEQKPAAFTHILAFREGAFYQGTKEAVLEKLSWN